MDNGCELSRQVLKGLQDHHAELKTRIKSLGATYGDTTNLLKLLDNFAAAGKSLIADRFETLTAGGGVFIQPWPAYYGADIVKRELELRRPFMKMEPGTIGHRDTVIWLGLLELAASFPDDTILFVTRDKGFRQKDQLHPDLLEDLATQSTAPERIRLFSGCYPMLEFLKEVAPSATAAQSETPLTHGSSSLGRGASAESARIRAVVNCVDG